MVKTLTRQEFIERSKAKHGDFLDYSKVVYINAHTEVVLICPKHGEFSQRPMDHLNNAHGCPKCAAASAGSRKRVSREVVDLSFFSKGFKLLTRYRGNRQKLAYECPEKHRWSTTWSAWLKSNGVCAICCGRVVPYSRIKKSLNDEGYKLLWFSKKGSLWIKYLCPHGHTRKTRWNNWEKGHRCPECAGFIVTHEQVEAAFSDRGYTLLDKYDGKDKKLGFICPVGHRHSITWGHFSKGHGCAYCAGHIVTHSQVEAALGGEGYEMVGIYEGCAIKFDCICPKGHEFQTCWDYWKNGNRCPFCAESGFNEAKPASLYYLAFDLQATTVYKIGITNRAIADRFAREERSYRILLDQPFELGLHARKQEQSILMKFKNYRYQGDPILKNGNTELFYCDVLGLDSRDRWYQLSLI